MSHPVHVSVDRPSAQVVGLVRQSCLAVANRPVALAEAFYAHLFEMAPGVRRMFPADMTGQMEKMTTTLIGSIAALDEPDTAALVATLRQLGADHATRYGVAPEHYYYIGHALTRAVRDVAGSAYSGTMSSAWIALYQWVARHMTAGAQAATRTAAPTPHPTYERPEPRPALAQSWLS